MKTFSAKMQEVEKTRDWFVIDAKDKTLGRVSTEIVKLLLGKHKPIFTPHADTGDFVVVINAKEIRLSGNKEQAKSYFRHTGYVGNEKHIALTEVREKHPERIIEHAVSGMLPKNKLRARRLKRLKIFVGGEHTHQAQLPKTYEV